MLNCAQLLLQTLVPYLHTFPDASFLHSLPNYMPQGVPSPLLELFHSHGPSAIDHVHDHDHGSIAHDHGPGAVLNPNAAWFALASIVVKEWLYRLTSKVAAEEHSPVLKANAYQ